MTRLMSHGCVGRSFLLSYDIGEIGENHITENIYRETILMFGTLTKSDMWFRLIKMKINDVVLAFNIAVTFLVVIVIPCSGPLYRFAEIDSYFIVFFYRIEKWKYKVCYTNKNLGILIRDFNALDIKSLFKLLFSIHIT